MTRWVARSIRKVEGGYIVEISPHDEAVCKTWQEVVDLLTRSAGEDEVSKRMFSYGPAPEAAKPVGAPRPMGGPRNGAIAAFLLAAGLLCGAAPLRAQDEPDSSVLVEAGMGVSVSDDTAAVPVARITIDGPIYLGESSVARIRAVLQLHGSPDATEVDLRDVRTFQGAELDLELGRRIGSSRDGRSASYAVLKVGGATRRDARAEGARPASPRERFPGWASLGLAVEHRDTKGLVDRRLTVTYGADQLSSPESWTPRHVIVSGHARLMSVKGVSLSLGGEIHRPLWGSGRSVFRVQSLMGWGG